MTAATDDVGVVASRPMFCPSCQSPMEAKVDPDITIDVCHNCGGTWLDRGELTALVTGLGGNLEWSAHRDAASAPISDKTCAHCKGSWLKKVGLLHYSGVEVEVCTQCQGVYLDAGEIAAANKALAAGRSATPELREQIDGHLVRLEREPVHSFGIAGYAYVLAVFFERKLDVDLHITPSGWLDRIFRLVHRSSQTVVTGNAEFDARLRVRSTQPEAARQLLPPPAQWAILRLLDGAAKLTFVGGTIEIGELGIVYREKAHADDKLSGNVESEAERQLRHQLTMPFTQHQRDTAVRAMLDAVKAIEAARS